MSPSVLLKRRMCAHVRRISVGTALVFGCLWAGQPIRSDEPAVDPIVRVEEDWVLVLYEPSEAVTAPQFHTVMSPSGHLNSYFAQVTWNYQELPYFAGGGLQMQVWNGDHVALRDSFITGMNISTTAETVRWTQALQIDGADVRFTVTNGRSDTWGEFGYPQQDMRLSAPFSPGHLNGYSTEVSAANAQITFGANRVGSLVITEVRRYTAGGAISVDATPKVIHQLN